MCGDWDSLPRSGTARWIWGVERKRVVVDFPIQVSAILQSKAYEKAQYHSELCASPGAISPSMIVLVADVLSDEIRVLVFGNNGVEMCYGEVWESIDMKVFARSIPVLFNCKDESLKLSCFCSVNSHTTKS